ncbi:hypothetical protein [Amycolatopsis sp. cmx-11-12]|uniref:hypothetical protein n=1 Tax=Amycolatopsis sp. cmx-11-12 TaxID=2785795 RepID=UPI003917D62C
MTWTSMIPRGRSVAGRLTRAAGLFATGAVLAVATAQAASAVEQPDPLSALKESLEQAIKNPADCGSMGKLDEAVKRLPSNATGLLAHLIKVNGSESIANSLHVKFPGLNADLVTQLGEMVSGTWHKCDRAPELQPAPSGSSLKPGVQQDARWQLGQLLGALLLDDHPDRHAVAQKYLNNVPLLLRDLDSLVSRARREMHGDVDKLAQEIHGIIDKLLPGGSVRASAEPVAGTTPQPPGNPADGGSREAAQPSLQVPSAAPGMPGNSPGVDATSANKRPAVGAALSPGALAVGSSDGVPAAAALAPGDLKGGDSGVLAPLSIVPGVPGATPESGAVPSIGEPVAAATAPLGLAQTSEANWWPVGVASAALIGVGAAIACRRQGTSARTVKAADET